MTDEYMRGYNKGFDEGTEYGIKATVEPCDNAVNREAVLDIINFEDKWLLDAKGHNANTEIAFSGMKSRIAELPSVRPQEPKTGKWIERESGTEQIRAEVADTFIKHGLGNTEICFDILNIIDRKGEPE